MLTLGGDALADMRVHGMNDSKSAMTIEEKPYKSQSSAAIRYLKKHSGCFRNPNFFATFSRKEMKHIPRRIDLIKLRDNADEITRATVMFS